MNKLLKKSILAISLLTTVVFGLTGCGIVEIEDIVLYQSGDTVIQLSGFHFAIGFLILIAVIAAIIFIVRKMKK
jgi:hypothetical protein